MEDLGFCRDCKPIGVQVLMSFRIYEGFRKAVVLSRVVGLGFSPEGSGSNLLTACHAAQNPQT